MQKVGREFNLLTSKTPTLNIHFGPFLQQKVANFYKNGEEMIAATLYKTIITSLTFTIGLLNQCGSLVSSENFLSNVEETTKLGPSISFLEKNMSGLRNLIDFARELGWKSSVFMLCYA